QSGRLEYFSVDSRQQPLAQWLTRPILDMRLARVPVDALREDALEERGKARDLAQIYRSYLERLDERRLVDLPGCLSVAVGELHAHRTSLPDGLCVLIPEPLQLTALEQQLVVKLKAVVPVRAPDAAAAFSPAAVRQRIG